MLDAHKNHFDFFRLVMNQEENSQQAASSREDRRDVDVEDMKELVGQNVPCNEMIVKKLQAALIQQNKALKNSKKEITAVKLKLAEAGRRGGNKKSKVIQVKKAVYNHSKFHICFCPNTRTNKKTYRMLRTFPLKTECQFNRLAE